MRETLLATAESSVAAADGVQDVRRAAAVERTSASKWWCATLHPRFAATSRLHAQRLTTSADDRPVVAMAARNVGTTCSWSWRA
jgi:hypothetical protein